MAQKDTRKDGMKNPDTDRPMKQSPERDQDIDRDRERRAGGQGDVKDPNRDRRLKENRE